MTKTKIKQLFIAIEKHDHDAVLSFLKENPEGIEVVGSHNAHCRDKTPLMFAMQCEDFELANKLIEMGANINARMPGGPESSVIQLAIKFGHGLNPNFEKWLSFITKLIDLGVSPNEGLWPACHAYNKKPDKPQIISMLLDKGALPDLEVGSSGSTVKELVQINSQRYSQQVLDLFGI